MPIKDWVTKGYDDFSQGTFGNGGQNLYVSSRGVLQRIYQYDLNHNGYFDLVFANCQNHHEHTDSLIYTLDGKRFGMPCQGSVCGMIADLNGDGYKDLIIPGEYDLANPFASADIYTGSREPYSENRHFRLPTPWCKDCCNGNFDGTGKPTLAFALPKYKLVRIFARTDVGYGWHGYQDLPIFAANICAADLDGDGIDELIVREEEKTQTTIYWGGKGGLDVNNCTILPELPASEIRPPEKKEKLTSEMEFYFVPPRLLQKVRWAGRDCFTLSTGKTIIFYAATARRELEKVLELEVPMALSVAIGDLDGDGYDDIAVATSEHAEGKAFPQYSYVIWNGPEGIDKRPRTVIETKQACDVDIYGRMLLVCQAEAEYSYTADSLLFTYPDFEHPRKFQTEDARRCYFIKNPGREVELFFVCHFSRSSVGYHKSFVYWGGPQGYSADNMTPVPCWCATDSIGADLDDDGWAELVICNNAENSLQLDPGHHIHHFGPGGFEPEKSCCIDTMHGWSVVAGDFRHCGCLDLIGAANNWNCLRWWYGGADQYKKYVDIKICDTSAIRWIQAVDINNNGWLDLIVPLISPKEPASLILWGGPEGFSLERSTKLNVFMGVSAHAADLTKNGYPDLIIGGHSQAPVNGDLPRREPHHSFVTIYWNGPEGISEHNKATFRADAASSLCVGDFNNDGWLDIFVGSYHNGIDRDIDSFIYWNREGQFRELDRQRIFTHSASGALCADFNEDGYVDLVVANHKVNGDHHGYSSVWWNGPKGFNSERCTHLPTEGPHGMSCVEPGNMLTRGPEEYYYSKPKLCKKAARLIAAHVEAEIPPKTWVRLTVRCATNEAELNDAPWKDAANFKIPAGCLLQYRLELGATLSLRSPRVTEVRLTCEEN